MPDRRIVFETRWFQIEELSSSEPGTSPYYLFGCADSVVVVALTEARQVILVRQFRPARDKYTVECPAGAIEARETPPEAAVRELREETGYVAGEMHYLGKGGLGLDRQTASTHCFVVFGMIEGPTAPEDGIEVLLFNLKSFSALIQNGEFEQLAALGAVLKALLAFPDQLADLAAIR